MAKSLITSNLLKYSFYVINARIYTNSAEFDVSAIVNSGVHGVWKVNKCRRLHGFLLQCKA
jgi:hypothetical protein